MTMEDFDTYNCPTFYMNVAIPEPAGGGNVRIWNCTRRHGLLIPVCEIIIPAIDLVIAAREVTQTAMAVFKGENQMEGLAN